MAETGLSDFHRMTLTVTKNELSEPQTKSCELPDYKRFANVRYRNELLWEISDCYFEFTDSEYRVVFFLFMLNNFRSTCTLEAEVGGGNHRPFINETLKEIMKRTKL